MKLFDIVILILGLLAVAALGEMALLKGLTAIAAAVGIGGSLSLVSILTRDYRKARKEMRTRRIAGYYPKNRAKSH